MAKSIQTLIEDIHSLINPENHKEPDQENLRLFLEGITKVLTKVCHKDEPRDGSRVLRMSSLGKPARQLWYDSKMPAGETQSKYPGSKLVSFLYGSVMEEVLLFLAREAGHKVEHQQKKVEFEGIQGSLDCYIDGVLTDVKTASGRAFGKFSEGGILRGDDPFGYIAQISGYSQAEDQDKAAFWSLNKETGEMNLLTVNELDLIDVSPLIKQLKAALARDTPPPKCYEDEAYGASGNRGLAKGCVFCPHKHKCWENLRVFNYAKGPEYLTKVVKTPNVEEITHKIKK